MSEQSPTVGRIVHYRLSDQDVERIQNQRMMANQHDGNQVRAGDIYPAMVVRVHDGNSVNMQVFMDGPDVYWATSRKYQADADQTESLNGTWFWPSRA